MSLRTKDKIFNYNKLFGGILLWQKEYLIH